MVVKWQPEGSVGPVSTDNIVKADEVDTGQKDRYLFRTGEFGEVGP